jgi:hypothetical protein
MKWDPNSKITNTHKERAVRVGSSVDCLPNDARPEFNLQYCQKIFFLFLMSFMFKVLLWGVGEGEGVHSQGDAQGNFRVVELDCVVSTWPYWQNPLNCYITKSKLYCGQIVKINGAVGNVKMECQLWKHESNFTPQVQAAGKSWLQ